MKNLLVANYRPQGRVKEPTLRAMVEAQIENSVALGWEAKDIVLVSNLEFDTPTTTVKAPLNASCLTGSKMFALETLFELGMVDETEIWWAHDLDAWQNHWFEAPPIADIALAEYSRPRFNGGSVFLRAAARDLVLAITDSIRRNRMEREEPAIDRILRLPAHADRVTVLNSTYNVGCSAFAVRYGRSHQPILVSHFHPTSGSGWRTHVCGHNQIGAPSVSERLGELLAKRFHGGNAPKPRHYRLRNSFHLGDNWARLNYALRLLEKGERFGLYLPNETTKEIFDALELGRLQPHLLSEKQVADPQSRALFHRIETGSTAYACPYFRTKVRPQATGWAIGYALEANWKQESKIPPTIGEIVPALQAALPGGSLVALGKPHQTSVSAVITTMASLRLVLAVDNGIAHVARSVGVPLFLLEHLHPLARGFPPQRCDYTKVTMHNVVEQIVAFLRREGFEERSTCASEVSAVPEVS